MKQNYKISFIIVALIAFVIIIYAIPTSRHWTYYKIVEVFVPKLIGNIDCDSSIVDDSYILLDARSKEEYAISHLPNSYWIGDDNLALQRAINLIQNKDTHCLIYCSIGYRSQKIGKQIQNTTSNNVSNLKGGIFRWHQLNLPLEDSLGYNTSKIHPYSTFWGIWKD